MEEDLTLTMKIAVSREMNLLALNVQQACRIPWLLHHHQLHCKQVQVCGTNQVNLGLAEQLGVIKI